MNFIIFAWNSDDQEFCYPSISESVISIMGITLQL